MSYALSLSQLLNLVQDTLDAHFYGQAFWVKCEVTDVKRYDSKNWCFCKLLEKKGNQVIAETPGVFWQQGYLHIRKFEQTTGQKFENGIAIHCLVMVKFHAVYGLKLEIQEIDLSFSIGQLELARQETIRQLLLRFPQHIRQEDDLFVTSNNQLPLPRLMQRVALVTANHSDGQRDFMEELTKNAHGYQFRITGFYTTIQGNTAPGLLVKQLENIATKAHLFDIVVIVRGGGSQTDLKPFDDFELAKTVALFPLPILTGIGHDRNTSITDLMARQYKVPTKVAAAIVDHNHQAAIQLVGLQEQLEDLVESLLFEKQQQLKKWEQTIAMVLPGRLALRKQRLFTWHTQITLLHTRRTTEAKKGLTTQRVQIQSALERYIRNRKEKLASQIRLVEQLSPEAVLNRGFAIAEQEGKIVSSIAQLDKSKTLITKLSDGFIASDINKINKDEG